MEMKFEKEAKDLLIEGVNELNRAVSKTMGPNGSTVIIPSDKDSGKYIVTKDGVSVARAINFKDPYKNIGAQLIKEAAEQTVKEAGDGTTTATVLATAFVNNLREFPYNDIHKAFDDIIPKVIKELELNSRKLDIKDIIHVASISANNDLTIANKIQDAYNHSEVVKIEESNNTEDILELVNGMTLRSGYMSKHFETDNKKAVSELTKPKVLIVDGKIDNIKPFQNIFQSISSNNESLLLIVEYIDENILRHIESNVLSKNIKVCVMKSPGFSTHRKNLLDDIAFFTKAEVVKDLINPVPIHVLGVLESSSIYQDRSVLVKDPLVNIDERIETYKERLKVETDSYDKELLEQRIENLKAKVSLIKVGGKTELEMKERFDRYDDAVKSVACALEEGIVEGGGIALKSAAFNLNASRINESVYDNIYDSFAAPVNTILKNGNTDHRFINMFEENIIDPLKVTKTALLNAVAVAKTILSTEAIVLHESQWTN